jgi:hypothetical protein
VAESGGQPGNNNPGKNRAWTNALRRELEGNQNADKLKRLAEKLVEMALEGNIAAYKEMGDRLEGKPAQGIDVTTKGESMSFLESIAPTTGPPGERDS